MESIKISIKNYFPINKQSLKAKFTLVIQPYGQKILDCKYFIQENGERWIAFPTKEIKYNDGRKPDYIPLISYEDKKYLEALKVKAIEALKKLENQGLNDGATNLEELEKGADSISGDSPPIW